MARIWGTRKSCKHCGQRIEWNTAKKQWQAMSTLSAVCKASQRKIHEPED